jgi:CRP/FNR family cyclic AMP-dependent transcriptional regulator
VRVKPLPSKAVAKGYTAERDGFSRPDNSSAYKAELFSTIRENGKEAILAVIEAGNWFGQMSMVGGAPHAYDVVALEHATVLVARPQAFDTLMNGAVFSRAISQLQSMHTGWLYQIIDDSAAHSTRARIARRLLLLASGDMTMASQGRQEISVSQEMLAMVLSITRRTLALELKAMVAKGAITLHHGRIQILSRETLLTNAIARLRIPTLVRPVNFGTSPGEATLSA